jgi:hypothetical protein
MGLNVTVEGTLFLVDLGTYQVTICTWAGEEATLPLAHLSSFIDCLRSAGVEFPSASRIEIHQDCDDQHV